MRFGTLYDALMSSIAELRKEGGGRLILHREECAIYPHEPDITDAVTLGECVCEPFTIDVPGDS